MTRFQLVYRGDNRGRSEWSEYRFNNDDGEPHIDGQLVVDGEAYVLHGVEWLLREDSAGDSMARFVCTLVVEPTDA